MTNRRRYMVFLLGLVSLAIAYLYITRPLNYLESSFPIYLADPEIICDSASYEKVELTVVSYNIKHGDKIPEAVDVLTAVPYQGNRVLLLQEMHADAVSTIADQLGMYYVYYPLNRSYLSQQDFGNAILATMPLQDTRKIILPHGQLHNDRRRGMTVALACLGGRTVMLGSVHGSTVLLSESKRKEQIDYLAAVLKQYQGIVDISIVGGDFNSATTEYRDYITAQFLDIGYDFTTAGLGPTHESPVPFLESELDLIYCDNCTVHHKGIISDARASDHYPVWMIVTE